MLTMRIWAGGGGAPDIVESGMIRQKGRCMWEGQGRQGRSHNGACVCLTVCRAWGVGAGGRFWRRGGGGAVTARSAWGCASSGRRHQRVGGWRGRRDGTGMVGRRRKVWRCLGTGERLGKGGGELGVIRVRGRRFSQTRGGGAAPPPKPVCLGWQERGPLGTALRRPTRAGPSCLGGRVAGWLVATCMEAGPRGSVPSGKG